MVNFLRFFFILVFIFYGYNSFGQTSSNTCAAGSEIVIANQGLGIGTFSSDTFSLFACDTELGESFPNSLVAHGQTQRSVWYKFKLGSQRGVRVTLKPVTSTHLPNSVGLAVYRASNCLPNQQSISELLTPISTFGSTYNSCVPPGDYYIQVVDDGSGIGDLAVTVQTMAPVSTNDMMLNPYRFNVVNSAVTTMFDVSCLSMEDSVELCDNNKLPNAHRYNKTAWFTFTSPQNLNAFLLTLSKTDYKPFSDTSIVGYSIYSGNVAINGTFGLRPIIECDTFHLTSTSTRARPFICNALTSNTVYSIKLVFHEALKTTIQLSLDARRAIPTKAPLPIPSLMANENKLGVINDRVLNLQDNFTCESRHSNYTQQNCTILQDTLNGTYNLSTFYTFTLEKPSYFYISTSNAQCGTNVQLKLYNKIAQTSCTEITNNDLYKSGMGSLEMRCLPVGQYTLQVMGIGNAYYNNQNGGSMCLFGQLGTGFNIRFESRSLPNNTLFNLTAPNKIFKFNNGNPLAFNNQYSSIADTFNCDQTIIPQNIPCTAQYQKGIYKQFTISDSSFVTIKNFNQQITSVPSIYRAATILYEGDAAALSVAQNVWTYPNRIAGLAPISPCMINNVNHPIDYCLTPGTYTLATLGDSTLNGFIDSLALEVLPDMNIRFGTPLTAQNMGNVLDSFRIKNVTTFNSLVDTFTCRDNAITIDGHAPCDNKASYMEFYVSQPTNRLRVETGSGNYTMAIFSGRASTGVANLSLYRRCSQLFTSPLCDPIPAGWYTIVIYGRGSGYDTRTHKLQNRTTNFIKFSLAEEVILQPKTHNRPYLAAVDTNTGLPYEIAWNFAQNNATYPNTRKHYQLNETVFDCIPDTPYVGYNISTCDSYNRVSYHVINVPYYSYLNIYNQQKTSLFSGDIRVDSANFLNKIPIASCKADRSELEICNLVPGVYTIVIYGKDSDAGKSIQTSIMVDKVGKSRFDFITNAYDFGIVPSNQTFIAGRIGDINPLDANRAPSNDIIYCTTGGSLIDSVARVHSRDRNNDSLILTPYNIVDSNISLQDYTSTFRHEITRNLWYTFQTVGNVKSINIEVDKKTLDYDSNFRMYLVRYTGNDQLTFDQLKNSNLFDSTLFVKVGNSIPRNSIVANKLNTSFDCNALSDTNRFFILIEAHTSNSILTRPNAQIEVKIAIENHIPTTDFDFYSTANHIGTINTYGQLYNGTQGDYRCATMSRPYPNNLFANGSVPTLWYSFNVNPNVQSNLRIRMNGNNAFWPFTNMNNPSAPKLLLFKETIPGDSVNGLVRVPLSAITVDSFIWGVTCISELDSGKYYILYNNTSITGVTSFDFGYPQVVLDTLRGNYCVTAVTNQMGGNSVITDSLNIQCHDIGTDYGEFGQFLTCPPYAATQDYKSSWFRVDITGNDTVDLTAKFRFGNHPIYFRKMTGDCNSMVHEGCVVDTATVNVYSCLYPGTTHYFQVFTPSHLYGQIKAEFTTTVGVDTCKEENACITNAHFNYNFDCSLSDSIYFNNQSTFGRNVTYLWDFGYNNDTSHAIAPAYKYPTATTNANYDVTLTVYNQACNDTAIYRTRIVVPAIIDLDLGNDIYVCGTDSVVLNGGNYFGAVYTWDNNSSNYNRVARDTGTQTYWVRGTLNGCTDSDTIRVTYSKLNNTIKDTLYQCTANQNITLYARRNNINANYYWSNNSTADSIIVNTPGWYVATVVYDSCTVNDSFLVMLADTSIRLLPPDTLLCNFTDPFRLNATILGGSNYLWSTTATTPIITVNNSGTYWVQAQMGSCTLSDTISIGLAPVVNQTVYDTICSGTGYTLPSNRVVTVSGTYQDTLMSRWGCDSIITTHLMVNPSDTQQVTIGICYQQLPYTWQGNTYTQGGNYNVVLTNRFGCDSTILLQLNLDSVIVTSFNDSVCTNTLPYVYNGNSYMNTGIYTHTFANIAGCDSIVNLNLTVLQADSHYVEDGVCINQGYVFGDTTLYISGRYVRTFINQYGCDSTVTLDLQVGNGAPRPTVISPVYFCQNTPASALTATGTNLLWYTTATGGTGSTNAPIPNTATIGSTTYYVTQTIGGCESNRVPLVVNIISRPDAAFTIDSLSCANSATRVRANTIQNGFNYIWDWDGGTATSVGNQQYDVVWNNGGAKYVTLYVQGTYCNSDTITKKVNVLNTTLALDTIFPDYICVNTINRLGTNNSNDPELTYQWWVNGLLQQTNTPYFDLSFSNVDYVRVKVTVTHPVCGSLSYEDSIYVSSYPKADIQPNLYEVCVGDTLELWNSEIIGNYTYTWTPLEAIAEVNNPHGYAKVLTTYSDSVILTVTNKYGCAAMDTAYLNRVQCCDVFYPTAFSPNRDGLNDIFKVVLKPNQSFMELAIYNRNGQQVFYTQDPNEGWDGSYNGQQGDMGVYFFWFKYKCTDGKIHTRKSDLTLVR